MTEPKTNCKTCGVQILQRTADETGGLCMPCHVPQPDPVITPVPPLDRATLDQLIATKPPDFVIDALFDPACDKVNFRPEEMTEGDIIVYTIWTFLGETNNGGIIQYLTNQSGGWAHCCGKSLRKVGADKYAQIIEECIRQFTDAESAQDPKWESDLLAYEDDHPDEPFEAIEEPFWGFDNDELQDLLYNYIFENRDVFAPFIFGAQQ